MSVSLQEVVASAGYDLSTYEGAQWLKSQEFSFEGMLADAEDVIGAEEERLAELQKLEDEVEEANAEAEYKSAFPPEEGGGS